MGEHPNASAYRRAVDLLVAGDIDGYLEHVSVSIAWWDPNVSEPIVGRSALRRHLRGNPARHVTNTIHDILANDEHLVALVHAVKETASGPADLSFAEVLHFEDGLITKRQVFPSNVRAAMSFYEIE